ncbi:unnamed protein product [Protopolystoma xenopodis]|uniref:Uncharacterized protein n=1 Tax=Protopolystoma xenopodis TaxID=117903 RepID=A0A448XBZ5_9PLAT|nr:unnamed protein product [Protopolystoma xenopodis]
MTMTLKCNSNLLSLKQNKGLFYRILHAIEPILIAPELAGSPESKENILRGLVMNFTIVGSLGAPWFGSSDVNEEMNGGLKVGSEFLFVGSFSKITFFSKTVLGGVFSLNGRWSKVVCADYLLVTMRPYLSGACKQQQAT